MAEEESLPVVPNPYDIDRVLGIIEEITARAKLMLELNAKQEARMKDYHPWFRQEPTEWTMKIMSRLKVMSRLLGDYKEVRAGLIDVAAVCLIALNYGDQLFKEFTTKKS